MQAGLASLPVAVGIVLAAGISTKLVEKLPPRAVAVPGLLTAAGALRLIGRGKGHAVVHAYHGGGQGHGHH